MWMLVGALIGAILGAVSGSYLFATYAYESAQYRLLAAVIFALAGAVLGEIFRRAGEKSEK